MGVGVDQPGDHGRPAQLDDAAVAVAPAQDLGARARGQHAAARDGERLDHRAPRVEGQDAPADEDQPAGYFIHPFSRYARSAPGWSGMPTRSGCHAVCGLNAASPPWPRTSASLFSSTVFVTV